MVTASSFWNYQLPGNEDQNYLDEGAQKRYQWNFLSVFNRIGWIYVLNNSINQEIYKVLCFCKVLAVAFNAVACMSPVSLG